jgi:hypothetical protein
MLIQVAGKYTAPSTLSVTTKIVKWELYGCNSNLKCKSRVSRNPAVEVGLGLGYG